LNFIFLSSGLCPQDRPGERSGAEVRRTATDRGAGGLSADLREGDSKRKLFTLPQ